MRANQITYGTVTECRAFSNSGKVHYDIRFDVTNVLLCLLMLGISTCEECHLDSYVFCIALTAAIFRHSTPQALSELVTET